MWLDLTIYSIPRALIWVYKNASRWGIQTSMPYLDHRLVEMFYSFPPEDKLRNGKTKYIFRKAVSGLLPEKIVQRKDKDPFYIPGKEWFTDDKCFKFTLDVFNSAKFRNRGYWNQEKLLQQLYLYRNIKRPSSLSNTIWKCLITELWFRAFIDG